MFIALSSVITVALGTMAQQWKLSHIYTMQSFLVLTPSESSKVSTAPAVAISCHTREIDGKGANGREAGKKASIVVQRLRLSYRIRSL